MGNIVRSLIVFGIVIFVLNSCSVIRKGAGKKEEFSLSERKQIEYQYTFAEANRSKLTGNFEVALSLFAKSLDINKKSDAAAYEIANIYFAFGRNDLALKFGKLALQLDPSNKWYYFQLARIYQSTGEKEKTVEVYKSLVKQFPDVVPYRLTMSGLMAEAGLISDALKVLNELEKEYGLNEQVSILKHNIYLHNGNYEKAFHEINELIKHFPDDIRFLGMLAELYGNLGMEKQALETYKKMFSIEPDNGLIHFSLAEFYVERARFSESFSHFARAFRDENIELGEKINSLFKLYNDNAIIEEFGVEIGQLVELLISVNKNVTEVRFLGADYFIRAGNYERAVIELEEIVKYQPDNLGVNEQLVILLSYTGEYEKLVEYCKQALNFFPDKTIIWYFYGIGLYQTNDFSEAVKAFENGILHAGEEDEMKISLMLMLGDTHNKLEEYDRSDRYFNEVLKLDDQNTIALNNYAYYLSLREVELEKAERMSRITIDREPENSTYLDTYAWVLYKKGLYYDALRYIEKAMKFLEEENAEVIEHYGDILLKNGKKEKAVEMWKRAYELDNQRKELLERIRNYEK